MPPNQDKIDRQHTDHVSSVGSIKSSGSSNKGVSSHAQHVAPVTSQFVEGTEEEKRLKRKLDWRILPCTWVLYLLGYLDRANVRYAAPFAPIHPAQTSPEPG